MKFDKLIDIFMTRNMRCPLCSRSFEKTMDGRATIKKKSMSSGIPAQPEITISLVNDSVRFDFGKKHDTWHTETKIVECKNIRHAYWMKFDYEINLYQQKTQKYCLLKEYFDFNHHHKKYNLQLDYINNDSQIKIPNKFEGGHITKPGIIQVTDKNSIINKIDRLFNLA